MLEGHPDITGMHTSYSRATIGRKWLLCQLLCQRLSAWRKINWIQLHKRASPLKVSPAFESLIFVAINVLGHYPKAGVVAILHPDCRLDY